MSHGAIDAPFAYRKYTWPFLEWMAPFEYRPRPIAAVGQSWGYGYMETFLNSLHGLLPV